MLAGTHISASLPSCLSRAYHPGRRHHARLDRACRRRWREDYMVVSVEESVIATTLVRRTRLGHEIERPFLCTADGDSHFEGPLLSAQEPQSSGKSGEALKTIKTNFSWKARREEGFDAALIEKRCARCQNPGTNAT